jgi:hypothetical protein
MTGKIVNAFLLVALIGCFPRGYSQEEDLLSAVPLVDTLNQSNLQDAFRILQRRYVGQDQLSYVEMNRAALEGLLGRLGPGAQLLPEEEGRGEKATYRLVSELISEDVAYIRPARVAGVELKSFDTALRGFARSPASALVLDLRCPAGTKGGGDFADTAAFAGRFLPKGTALFTVERAGDNGRPQLYSTQKKPAWKKQLAVLVDEDTGAAGEVLAVCLRAHLGCIVVGAKTSGLSADYEEVPIGPNARLRYAVAEAVFEDGTKIFGNGVAPDIESRLNPEAKVRIFQESQTEGVGKFVFEAERPRLNEAALVARTDPELPFRLRKGAVDPDPVPDYDRVVQSAVDALVARAVFEPAADDE